MPDDAKPAGILDIVLGGEEDAGDEVDEANPKERAIEDLFTAYKKNDVKAGAAAFERAYEICAAKHAEEKEPAAVEPGDDAEEYAEA